MPTSFASHFSRLTGLVQNGNNYDLLPLGEDIPDMDARIVHTITEEMMTPAAQYVNDHKGSELIALFLTIRGQGLAHTSNNKFEELNVIMSGIKTHNNLGKTLVFNIEDKDGKLTFERITTSDGDSWESKPDEKDLPAFATQELLDMFWKSYVIMRNMVTLKI